jgi:hypothetical protein
MKNYQVKFETVSDSWGEDDFRTTIRTVLAEARFSAKNPWAANRICSAIAEEIHNNSNFGHVESTCHEVFADGSRSRKTTAEETRRGRR